MYLGRTLAIAGTAYFAIHLATGAWTCYNEFCPGDNPNDWVYEYQDDNGKRFVVVDGNSIPADQYKEIK